MSSKNVVSILAAIVVLLLVYAWYDGGEKPLREIVEPVGMPGEMR